MNFKIAYHCPKCHTEWGSTPMAERQARLCCAPQAASIVRCGKCNRVHKNIQIAIRCCTPRDEVVLVEKIVNGRKKQEVTMPTIDLL